MCIRDRPCHGWLRFKQTRAPPAPGARSGHDCTPLKHTSEQPSARPHSSGSRLYVSCEPPRVAPAVRPVAFPPDQCLEPRSAPPPLLHRSAHPTLSHVYDLPKSPPSEVVGLRAQSKRSNYSHRSRSPPGFRVATAPDADDDLDLFPDVLEWCPAARPRPLPRCKPRTLPFQGGKRRSALHTNRPLAKPDS